MTRQTTSASSLAMRSLCLASHAMEDGMDNPETEVSKMGTLGHLYFGDKTLDRSKLDSDLQRCLSIGDEEEANFYAAVMASEGIPEGADFEQSAERELWFYDLLGQPLFPGHYDAWRYWPAFGVLAIPDLKLGYIKVTGAESNWQISAYGCMGHNLTRCRVFYGGIIQPRLAREERLTMARYDAAALEAAAPAITELYVKTTTEKHEPTPGEAQCRNCRGKSRCGPYISTITTPRGYFPPGVTKKDVPAIIAACTQEQRTALGEAIKFAKMIEDDWKADMLPRIERGEEPDWELKLGNKTREVTDLIAAYSCLLAADIPLTDAAYMSACSLSFEKLQKPVALALKIPLSKAERLINETLDPVIKRGQNAPSIQRK